MLHKHPLVIGNWKMNPMTEVDAVNLAKAVSASLKKVMDVTVVVTPPAVFLSAVAKAVKGGGVELGVQHVHPGPVGAFTGEMSPAQFAPFGVTFGIVGHSERRARGETNEQVNASVLMLLKSKMHPVICVGERERDAQANFYSEVEAQLVTAFASIPTVRYKDVVVAYEPVWAIGTGATATPADVLEMKLFIQKVLTKLAGRTAAGAVTILYGGSVNGDSAPVLFKDSRVAGFLVGGASLKPEEFAKIVTAIKG